MWNFNVEEIPQKICPKCGNAIQRDLEILPTAKPWYSYVCTKCGYGFYSHTKDPEIPERKETLSEIEFVVNIENDTPAEHLKERADIFICCGKRLFELMEEVPEETERILNLINICVKNLQTLT